MLWHKYIDHSTSSECGVGPSRRSSLLLRLRRRLF
nr:MAG TPA: hypothetical protein [Caudoviricetes sp.]